MATKNKGVQDAGTKRKRGLFTKELRSMMYGFGDDGSPLPESVALMEDLLIEHIIEMTQKAMEVSSKRGKMTTEDLLFLVRKDYRKSARVKQLINMHEELKKARKMMDNINEGVETQ